MTPRIFRRTGHIVAALAATVILISGCDGKLGKEFRSTAASSLESGLTTVVTGLIDGAFAVYDPGTDSSSSDNTTTTN
jgi:hypothetical protein